MNKMAFGQYYHKDSLIHKMDPRVKIIMVLLFMISIFVIPFGNFIILGSFMLFTILLVLLTKVPLIKYLKSLKSIIFLLVFTLIFQILFKPTGTLLFQYQLQFTIINISVSVLLLVIYFIIYRYIPLKGIVFIILSILIIYILGIPIYGNILNKKDILINIYSDGLIDGTFIVLRVLLLIVFSTILTLTTKPTTMNNAIESLLRPLEKLKIKTSIFAMMISIALRFIPTLFLEADKILKAQASRGVDFNEGSLKKKVAQIISLLVPMFIVSIRRAEDLAIAMEARGYIPGEKRTRIVELKMHFSDYLWLILFNLILIFSIIMRIYYAV